jgi:hypothetical protein
VVEKSGSLAKTGVSKTSVFLSRDQRLDLGLLAIVLGPHQLAKLGDLCLETG